MFFIPQAQLNDARTVPLMHNKASRILLQMILCIQISLPPPPSRFVPYISEEVKTKLSSLLKVYLSAE